jgi:hypothetical protein
LRAPDCAGHPLNVFLIKVIAEWGDTGPIEIGTILDDWPDKQPSDLGWVYVSIGGDVYSEGLTLVLMSENGNARVREVQFGRP